MSTNLQGNKKRKSSLFLWASLWLLTCSFAWNGSSISGGDNSQKVATAALEIGRVSRLSKDCTVKAAQLADASVRAEITNLRPTARLMKDKENQAIQNYVNSGCPERALVSIAFASYKIARDDLAVRKNIVRN